MADYTTHFSCLLDTGSAKNAEHAKAIHRRLAGEVDRDEGAALGFEMAVSPQHGPGVLWLHADGHGNPEDLTRFVLRCAEAFGLQGLWGFRMAHGCSRPRLDAYGGGAQVLDLGRRKAVGSIDCHDWLDRQLRPAAPDELQAEAAP